MPVFLILVIVSRSVLTVAQTTVAKIVRLAAVAPEAVVSHEHAVSVDVTVHAAHHVGP